MRAGDIAKLTFWSVATAAAYFCLGRYSLHLESSRNGISLAWPGAGISLAAIYIGGRRMIPAVLAGALGVDLVSGGTVLSVSLSAIASTVEPLLGAMLLRRAGFQPRMRRISDVMVYVASAAVVSTAVAATISALGYWTATSYDLPGVWRNWRDWWLGDLVGVLIVGSLLIICSDFNWRGMLRRRTVGMLTLGLLIAAGSYWLLDRSGGVAYLVLPLLFLMAFTYRQVGATVGSALVAGIAIYLTAHGHGPFLGDDQITALIRATIFLSVGSVTAQLVAAAVSERILAGEALTRLAESESALAESQRLALLGTMSMDLRTGETHWSDEVFHIVGLEPGDVKPSVGSWRKFMLEEDLPAANALVEQVYETSGSDVSIHRIRRSDGQLRSVELRFRFERAEDAAPEDPPIFCRGTLQDVTELTSAVERARTLFEYAPYPILVLDDVGTIRRSNVLAQQLFAATEEDLQDQHVSAFVFAPDSGDGVWHAEPGSDGVHPDIELSGRRSDGHEFAAEVSVSQLPNTNHSLVSVRDVTALRAASEKLNFQARHDPLTGLPNRLMFLEQLEMALARSRRSGRGLAVVFVDLDNFKFVNDSRGHDVGDMLLTLLTPKLGAAVRHGDLVGRLGGDEFVVLCEDLPDEEAALELADRVVEIGDEQMLLAGQEHRITLSAGVVMVTEPQAVTAHRVLRDADSAMYAAKRAGKSRAVLFDEHARELADEQIAVETSLRGACLRNEFELRYQPVVTLDDYRVSQVEALLRWRHPDRGVLQPAAFIEVAESTGLIAEIGAWVLEEACRQAVRWRAGVPAGAALPVSVNISAYELTHADLPTLVNRVLRSTGLDPSLLILETRESALLEDETIARRELGRLKALGVRLVIDDFGTGYSSLAALRDLSIDGLKLDRSFTHALGSPGTDGAMVGAVMGMADALDADVTAEGVETWQQARQLQVRGCGYAQGYLFGEPMTADGITRLISDGSGVAPVPG